MRLILSHQVTDGYTYWCTETQPVEYESAEALLVHFMDAARAALAKGNDFEFLGKTFSPRCFYERCEHGPRVASATYVKVDGVTYLECAPSVMTLDEFFADALRQA